MNLHRQLYLIYPQWRKKSGEERERVAIVTWPTWILERNTNVTDHDRWTYNHKKKRDKPLTLEAWRERKISPNKKGGNAQTHIFKWRGWLRAERVSECTLKTMLCNFREVLFGHQLLLWRVGTVYSYHIYWRKAWESYRREDRGFLLGGRREKVGNSFQYSENGEKTFATRNNFSLRSLHTGILPFRCEL